MQNIPIIGQGKEGTEIRNIRSRDIVHIERILPYAYKVHTADESFMLHITLETLREWLYEDGFRMIDGNRLINVHHLHRYTPGKGEESFTDPRLPVANPVSPGRSLSNQLEDLLEWLRDNPELMQNESAASLQLPTGSETTPGMRSLCQALIEAADHRRTDSQIRYLAYHDSLTDLPNRLMLREQMTDVFRLAQRTGKLTAVFFLDLDRVKVVNDTLGHHVGDLLLKHWAARFRDLIEPYGMVARFSGDEFILLLPEVDNLSFVHRIANEVIQLFRAPFVHQHHELFGSVSIGIALYPQDGTDPDALVKYADSAMYIAKGKGGNTYEFYNSEQNDLALQRLQLELDLRKAIEKREFLVHYQPIVDLETGRMTGMETLMRWQHPLRGCVSPMEFIPLAEETGLIIPIGTWVLEEACRQNREWQSQGLPPVCVSVNISVKQFQQPQFVEIVRAALHNTGLEARYLCLEITENIAMTHIRNAIQILQELRELGVALSIDDFGTGYSSLSYLKRFRVHTLKIDKSFIQELISDGESAAIVTAIIAMSKRLNIRTLAEGVETAEQVAFLQEHGCQEIQGFYFSKPLAAELFRLLLSEDRNFLERPH